MLLAMVQAFSKNPSTTGSDSSGSSVRPKYTRHDSQARDSRPLGAGAGRPPAAAAVAIDARRGRRNGTVEIVSLVQNCQATETTKPSNEAASYYSHEQMPPDTCAGQVVADSLDSGCMGPAYRPVRPGQARTVHGQLGQVLPLRPTLNSGFQCSFRTFVHLGGNVGLHTIPTSRPVLSSPLRPK